MTYRPDIENLLGQRAVDKPTRDPPPDSGPPTNRPGKAKSKRGPGRPPMAPNERYNQARAELHEIKVHMLKGDLIEIADVRRTWEGIARDVQAAVLAVPARLLAERPSLTPEDVAAIDAALRQALDALAAGEGGQ